MADACLGATVTTGPVPDRIEAPLVRLPWLAATPTEALLTVDGVGRFHVRDGCRVTVEPEPDATPGAIGAWLDATVTGLLLVQRRQFALHASTVRIGDRLVAVTGPSGAGKSTTVALLAAHGHAVVTDDVTPVDPATMTVRPSGRSLRLLPATAARIGLDAGAPESVTGKLCYPVVAGPAPAALGLVVALRRRAGIAAPVAVPLDRRSAIGVLLADTYRPVLRRLRPGDHLRWMAAIAAAVPVVRLDRPATGWTGDAVVDLMTRLCTAPAC